MARLLGIDYGKKRTGLAVSDPLQIIASPLETVETPALMDYLKAYVAREAVERFVVGEPLYPDGNPAQIHAEVLAFARRLEKAFPGIPVSLQDERYTSEDAKKAILQSGIGKMKRRDKSLRDKVAAALILQDFMGHR